jgi:2-polyprenyl-3-methyl-5-hydroxy-6-metoxy-1,4-benzoquinol methylase
MSSTIKKQVKGLAYLFMHPNQLKWIIIREINFGQRHRSKRKWVEWQKYDASKHIAMIRAHSAALQTSSLNMMRIRIFYDMVNNVGNGLRILDVGSGDGVISKPIVEMGNYVTSLELPEIATMAHRCGVKSIVAGDAEQLAFASSSFDIVIASEVLEHLWKPQNFLDEAHRVLRSKGHLIIETPEGKESLNYDSHKHYFTVELLKHMLGVRFALCEVKRLKPTGTAQTPTIILLLRKSSQ